jgi:hypothetical protein
MLHLQLYNLYMSEAIDRDSLLRVSTIVDLLDIGWRPGNAELDTARYVEKWGILPSRGAALFRMMGIVRSLPARRTIFIAPVFAIDRTANWARIWDEWIVIGDSLDDSPAFDAIEIRDATAAWLHVELGRLRA